MACISNKALHEKGLQSQEKATVHWLEARKKGASRPADKPLVNHSSNGRQPPVVFFDRVCMGFTLFALPKKCLGRLSSVPWGARRTVFSWAHRPAAVLGASTRRHPIPPRRATPAPAPPARPSEIMETYRMSGFLIRQVNLRLCKPSYSNAQCFLAVYDCFLLPDNFISLFSGNGLFPDMPCMK